MPTSIRTTRQRQRIRWRSQRQREGGFEFAYGSSINATVVAGAQVVYGAAKDTVLYGRGLQQVFTGGGTASATVVDSGGQQMVGFCGTSVGTVVNAGGLQSVYFTSVARNTTVNCGGSARIASGGTALDTTIHSGGSVELSDGTLGGSVVNNGTLTFPGGGTFSGQLSGTGSVVVSYGTNAAGQRQQFRRQHLDRRRHPRTWRGQRSGACSA